jgi:hypothetical protein
MDNGQPLIERPSHGASDILRRVADQIDRMNADTFGGVAVVVPPAGAGEPIEFLIIDPKKNAAQFYATIKTRIEGQIGDLEVQQRQAQAGFGQRR